MYLDTNWARWLIILVLVSAFTKTSLADVKPQVDLPTFTSVLSDDSSERRAALKKIEKNWQHAYAAPLVELMTLSNAYQVNADIIKTLQKQTGQRHGSDFQAWFEWIWSVDDPGDFKSYPEFKSWLYGHIDPKFRGYFSSDETSRIRLGEVRWGGVRQDGIPPLRRPLMIAAEEADYLEDDNVVFALSINGDARAYPKRILAWHEMFVDTVGGVDFAGVYCTLCGTMILYETKVGDVNHALGTSGFLYRSNKLMYDQATQSLWSTLLGQPVIGPLAKEEISLKWRSVVTTTWGEWRRRHPDTQVLSMDTGHRRDYGEGVAYQDYFSTDRLMFNVPSLDRRLKNKAEVLGLRFPEYPEDVLAISADYLANNPIAYEKVGQQDLVVLTDPSGANRVYEAGQVVFRDWDGDVALTDDEGTLWTLSEDALVSRTGVQLKRLPAYRAFWFGWYSAHKNTRLVD